MLQVTSLYAALMAVLLIYLSSKVIRARQAAGVSVGDGGDETLLRAIRTQGNFCEYAPVSLILLALVEANGFPAWTVYGLGLVMLAGRVLHAIGLPIKGTVSQFRIQGMVITFAGIALGAALSLGGFLWRLVGT